MNGALLGIRIVTLFKTDVSQQLAMVTALGAPSQTLAATMILEALGLTVTLTRAGQSLSISRRLEVAATHAFAWMNGALLGIRTVTRFNMGVSQQHAMVTALGAPSQTLAATRTLEALGRIVKCIRPPFRTIR
jgi:hypothetical protein